MPLHNPMQDHIHKWIHISELICEGITLVNKMYYCSVVGDVTLMEKLFAVTLKWMVK